MTDLEVCNWALLKLGQCPIKSLDDGGVKAEYCKILLRPLHRSLLRSFAWSFATRSADLSPLSSQEGRYGLPKKCLKVLKLKGEGELKGDCIVVCPHTSASLSLEYIEEVAISECDPLYQEALAYKLASELCPVLTSDLQFSSLIKRECEELKKIAIDMDGIENAEERGY